MLRIIQTFGSVFWIPITSQLINSLFLSGHAVHSNKMQNLTSCTHYSNVEEDGRPEIDAVWITCYWVSFHMMRLLLESHHHRLPDKSKSHVKVKRKVKRFINLTGRMFRSIWVQSSKDCDCFIKKGSWWAEMHTPQVRGSWWA